MIEFLRRYALPMLLIGAGVVFVVGGWQQQSGGSLVTLLATPTVTPEPIFPTRTPASVSVTPQTPTPFPTAVSTPLATAPAVAESSLIAMEERFGVAVVVDETLGPATAAGLRFGSYLNWNVDVYTPEAVYWRMVRLTEEGLDEEENTWEMIAEAAAGYPGGYWLIGNEMDVTWQDNVTPERYAELYHEVYTFIKEIDSTAVVGIGGVSQSTPLRRAYLDIVLAHYAEQYGESLPTDLWNVHGFVLREEADSWGVGIPPGMSDELAIPYEIEDHKDIDLFAQNIVDFRVWMAERGYRDTPLVLSEYGILMPADYGFDQTVVATYLEQSLDFLTTAADDEIGYAADNGRLVQWWFWYSVYDDESRYPQSNLFDLESGRLTPAGQVFSSYARE